MRLMFRISLPCLIAVLMLTTAGCGRFVAHRMMQSPNTYPTWFAPAAPVELAFDSLILTNFPPGRIAVGPPAAEVNYRIVEPRNFDLRMSTTNWTERGKVRYRFSLRTGLPGKTNAWTHSPRGTIVLLHGYGLAQFAMTPWALRLAEDGWRCVLVDLRGHGKSTGRRIYFGMQETHDLSQLLDQLQRDAQLTRPVAVMGESYGASLALRWKTLEPRLERVVAIAPYASLSNATLNLAREYAPWFPRAILKSGLKQLPEVLQVDANALDTTSVLAGQSVTALIVSGMADKIMLPADVREVFQITAPGSELVEIPGATHETVPYYFEQLSPLVKGWLELPSESKPFAQSVATESPQAKTVETN